MTEDAREEEEAGVKRDQYSHHDHAEMEWVKRESSHGRVEIEGWKCARCNVIAPPERADEVFDSHDCDHYRDVAEGVLNGV